MKVEPRMTPGGAPPPPPPVVESPSSGVKRLNNRPVFIVVGILAAFALVLVYVITQRGQAARSRADTEVHEAVVSTPAPDVLKGFDTQSGLIGAGSAPSAPGIKVLTDEQAELPPAPPGDPYVAGLQERRLQELEKALSASTLVNERTSAGGGSGGGQGGMTYEGGRPNPGGAQMMLPDALARQEAMRQQSEASSARFDQDLAARMQQARPAAGHDHEGEGGGTVNAVSGVAPRDTGPSAWQLKTGTEANRPYLLRAGYVIPGIMVSGINSDLEGQIVGQVAQPVYDSATGRQLLIPQGTRLVGTYQSSISMGQRRLFVAWQRMLFPDGRARDIGQMPGTDSAGYAGFKDRVDNHYARVFGTAFLMSGIVAGMSSGESRRSSFEAPTLGDDMRRALVDQMGRVATQMIQRNLTIAPTLEIRPGYRFNIMVTKDIDLDAAYVPAP